jgi:hypothetical protein
MKRLHQIPSHSSIYPYTFTSACTTKFVMYFYNKGNIIERDKNMENKNIQCPVQKL